MKKLIGVISVALVFGIVIMLVVTNQSSSRDQVKADSSLKTIEDNESNTVEVTETSQTETTESEYADIISLIQEYELPTDGIEKEDDETIYYENGYEINKTDLGIFGLSEPHNPLGEPSKEQYLPCVFGLIDSSYFDINEEWKDIEHANLKVDIMLAKISDAKKYTELYPYPVLSEPLGEIIKHLEEAKALMPKEYTGPATYDEVKVSVEKAKTIMSELLEVKSVALKGSRSNME